MFVQNQLIPCLQNITLVLFDNASPIKPERSSILCALCVLINVYTWVQPNLNLFTEHMRLLFVDGWSIHYSNGLLKIQIVA